MFGKKEASNESSAYNPKKCFSFREIFAWN